MTNINFHAVTCMLFVLWIGPFVFLSSKNRNILDSDVRHGMTVKATFHSTIFNIPMRPVREDQRHQNVSNR